MARLERTRFIKNKYNLISYELLSYQKNKLNLVCIQTLTLEKQIIKHFKNKIMAAIYVIKINVLRTELYWCDFSKFNISLSL